MMREQQHRFGMGCPSITGEDHAQCTEALLSSLNNSSLRHAKITKTLMQKQIAHLNSEATKPLASSSKTSISMRRRMDYHLRVRELLSIHTSKLHILLEQKECRTNTLCP